MDGVHSGQYGAMSDGSKRQRDDESECGLFTESQVEVDSPTTAYLCQCRESRARRC